MPLILSSDLMLNFLLFIILDSFYYKNGSINSTQHLFLTALTMLRYKILNHINLISKFFGLCLSRQLLILENKRLPITSYLI